MEEEKAKHTCVGRSETEALKYKEFLQRTQSQCKNLENENKKLKESHESQVQSLLLKLKEYEEKYGQSIKEKMQLLDKERILLNSLESMKQLEVVKNQKKQSDVIESQDEEVNNGS